MKEKPPYWSGQSERLFTRMHPGIRMALIISAHTRRVNPKSVLEEAIVELAASGDLDASTRYRMDKTYQACTYEIDSGVADQLRLISEATGESIQTLLHEALTRKLKINTEERSSEF